MLQEDYVDDVLDSPAYQALAKEIPDGGIPIFIQLCWDGAVIYRTVQKESMWPMTYSIVNFPPSLRNKLHIGMHVLSFDHGSTAALDKCASELLDLYNNPIESNGRKYYVIISQIIMDGQGRCKYCKLEGQRSLSGGCHSCNFKGRAFGPRRTVYDGYRRYLAPQDERRKAKSKKNKKEGLHFSFDEEGRTPTKRTYAEYIEDGTFADHHNGVLPVDTGYSRNGVKGVWSLHVLPYADKIHWTYDLMHTFANIITDSIKSITVSHSGRAGKLYKNENRTYCDSVVTACEKERIHSSISGGSVPSWVISANDCIDIDSSQKLIIGSFTSEEFVQNVMRGHHAERSHDSIYWAVVYSRWLLRDRGPVVDNILDIFDSMAVLNSNRLHVPSVNDVTYPNLIEALIKRSGLVPPSECPITLHELVHVCDQVMEIGSPRYSTLYKFEKINKLLKAFLFNKAKGPLNIDVSIHYVI